MNTDFENAIKKIVDMFGVEIFLDSEKFIAVFLDIAPKLKKEKKILSIALHEGIAKYFVNVDESRQNENVICVCRNLNGILEKDAINLIVRTFAKALGWRIVKESYFSENQQTDVNANIIISSLKNSSNEMTDNPTIKFDGIYCFDDGSYGSYLRFFPDGKVYGASSTGMPEQVIKWLGVKYKELCGVYKIKDNNIRFQLNSIQGRSEYWGFITKNGLDLTVKSNINGHSVRKMYRFHQSLSQQVSDLDFQELSLAQKRELADKGDARAELYMGDYFYNRKCSSKETAEFDYSMAIDWYERAANHGNVQAVCNLGDCYYYGNGAKKNYKKAAEYYLKAAELGARYAMHRIAECYLVGKGVKKDRGKYEFWCKKANPYEDDVIIAHISDWLEIERLSRERNSKNSEYMFIC